MAGGRARSGSARGDARRPGAGRAASHTAARRTAARGGGKPTTSGRDHSATSSGRTGETGLMSPRRWIALGSVLVMLAVLIGPTLKSYISQRAAIAHLQSQIVQQKQDVAAMQKEQQLWQSPEYVEQQARERLKFVKVGEKAYTVIDANPSLDQQNGTAQLSSGGGSGPWYGQLWSSVKAADNPQRAAAR